MIEIQCFTFNAFQENTYILFDETKDAVIFDPGCYENHEQQELDEFIRSNNLQVKRLINTHCHIDHVLGNHFVSTQYDVPLEIPASEEDIIRAVPTYAGAYGFPMYQPMEDYKLICEKDQLTFGNSTLEIRLAPGHSPGHLVFYHAEQSFLIGGDVIFQMSIGRTDLPGGDHDKLLNSIQTQLYTLPEDTVVHPGHGPSTNIGFEKGNNPFVKG